jgi:hypothetical protein
MRPARYQTRGDKRLMYTETICRTFIMVIVAMAFGVAAAAETNGTPNCNRLFVLPETHLRVEFEKESRTALALREANSSALTKKKTVQSEARHADTFIVATDLRAGEFQQYQRFTIIPPVHESDDGLTQCFDAVFRPEEYHVGKTMFSCSILTAINRKNPLCLLNPEFLHWSW